jgi:hypothetical protein
VVEDTQTPYARALRCGQTALTLFAQIGMTKIMEIYKAGNIYYHPQTPTPTDFFLHSTAHSVMFPQRRKAPSLFALGQTIRYSDMTRHAAGGNLLSLLKVALQIFLPSHFPPCFDISAAARSANC